MATPRVFVSSTCYDLADERDALASFCESFGFGCALSERGDIFYHPDLHTHESCVREISTCQIFVLIIGGRFGGKYVSDKNKSITNAEYSAARELGIPVFSFVKQDLLNDHNLWQKNKDHDFANKIVYPSIERQEHAIDIFSFVDQVRLAPINNGFFGFRLSREIFDNLRKQWASMFFEYLQTRSLSRQFSGTNESIATLTAASLKIEEIVRNIYKSVDTAGAEPSLIEIDLENRAKELFLSIAVRCEDREYLQGRNLNEIKENPPDDWWVFLTKHGYFQIEELERDSGHPTFALMPMLGISAIAKLGRNISKQEKAEFKYLSDGYAAYLKLSPEKREKIVLPYLFYPSEKDDGVNLEEK